MKISISLPAFEVEFLDTYVHSHDFASRSAAVQHAVALLREADLEAAYAEAWDEWEASGEAEVWDVTAGDGLGAR